MRRTLQFILLLLLAVPAQAAITFVQGNFTANAAATSQAVAFTSANTAGNLIIACMVWADQTSTASISDTLANTYTAFTGAPVNIGTGTRHQCWYAANIAAGANTVTTSISGVAVSMGNTIHEYSGLATVSPLDVESTATNGSSTTPTSNSLTTTNANDLLWSSAALGATKTWTAGTNFTLREASDCATTARKTCTEDRIVSATGTFTASFTTSTTANWGIFFVSFKAAGAVAACSNFITLMGAGCR